MCGAARQREQAGGDRAGETALRVGFVADAADEGFAGDANHDGPAQSGQLRQAAEHFQGMGGEFGEADAGVDGDGLRADPGLFGRGNADGEFGGHLAGDVGIDGPGIHCGGIAAHVHQNDGAAARRDERGGGGVVGQR